MRSIGLVLAAASVVFAPSAALAAERAIAIRPGDLKQQPFIDAASAGAVAANQGVSVLARQGGWVRVESNGQSGWMRMLNVRLETTGPATGSSAATPPRTVTRSSLTAPASLFHTGSSGKTVTTGVKGLDETDIRNSTPDLQQVAALDALAVDGTEAANNAASSGLKEQSVEYLKGGRR